MRKYYLATFLAVTAIFLLGLAKPARAACDFHESMTTTTKDISSWSTSCTITGTEGIDNPINTEGSTTSTAALTLSSGSITINNGGVLRAASISLSGGTISLQNGGKIEPGSGHPLFVADGDGDGWATNFTLYTATASGRRRLGLMKGFATTDCNSSKYSATNTCVYRRPITLTYSGGTLTNHDVVFTFDTATAIAAGKMTADCGDIRVRDSDETTALTYWIEGGCNTSATQIWVTVPSIPNGGKTIYLEYNGTTATNGFEAWTGKFTLLNDGACPSGWTANSDFLNTFPRGAATYGGTGGASSHAHNDASCTTGNASVFQRRNAGTVNYRSTYAHTHTAAKVDVNTASNVYPPYTKMVMCERANLYLTAGMVALFDAAVGTGWTRFTAMDGEFLMGHTTTYGGTGGANTHSHSTSGGYTTGNQSGSTVGMNESCGAQLQAVPHTHQSDDGTSATGNHLPPYLNMIFGSKNADGAAKANIITIVDVLPPLGWTRFTALDGNFVRGAASYGGTGGATTHNHSVTVSVALGGGVDYGANSCFIDNAGTYSASHSHPCTDSNVGTQSNLPPYTNAIFAQRNTPSATTAVGSESLY